MKTERDYLVFLDIDGVFTSSRVHYAHAASYGTWHRFDPVAVDFMNKIHDRYRVEFVLMSTWKNHLKYDNTMIEHWIRSAFGNSGFRGQFANPWNTDPHEEWVNRNNFRRGDEVKLYLNTFGQDAKDFILFDDNRYNFKEALGKGRLVQTDPENGLLYKHMLNAQSIMGNWLEK